MSAFIILSRNVAKECRTSANVSSIQCSRLNISSEITFTTRNAFMYRQVRKKLNGTLGTPLLAAFFLVSRVLEFYLNPLQIRLPGNKKRSKDHRKNSIYPSEENGLSKYSYVW